MPRSDSSINNKNRRRTMNTNNIFKALALAMLMPAMLLTTACSNDDDAVNNENTAKNGYTLPVTINVSRQDDGTTRATYTDNNNGTGTFAFGTGDKLFVWGEDTTEPGGAGKFAGSLTWTSGGTFSGTITTQNEWTSSAHALFTQATSKHATLLPAGYETPGFISITGTGFDAQPHYDYTKAFTLTKGAAVEQFSLEDTDGYTGSGFVLSPTNSILNFNITGLAASTEVAVVFTNTTPTPDDVISKNVTTDGSGNAKFAIAIHQTSPSSYDPGDLTLTVGGNAITINSTSKVFVAGHIYNVTRSASGTPTPAAGQFSVSATKKVTFSSGNLQATWDGTSWNWHFAENQWDYIGNAAGNTSINGNGTVNASNVTVDLFGWSTPETYYGIHNSSDNNTYSGDFRNWGTVPGIGEGWFTLSSAEWTYVFSTRTTGGTVFGTAQARYAHATINTDGTGVNGMILFPDGVDIASTEVTTAGTVNGNSAWATKCTTAQWSALAAKGCVFLPAAGYRNGTSVDLAGSYGPYWSSSPGDLGAYEVDFYSDYLYANWNTRYYGNSVRLVRPVQP